MKREERGCCLEAQPTLNCRPETEACRKNIEKKPAHFASPWLLETNGPPHLPSATGAASSYMQNTYVLFPGKGRPDDGRGFLAL